MSDPERYVAYYRMPAIGMASQGSDLTRQRQAISAFLDVPGRVLVGEFTEVMAPSFEGETPPAFQLAIECCRSLDASLVSSLTKADLRAGETGLTTEHGIGFYLLGDPRPPDTGTTDTNATDDAPYLNLKSRRRPPVPIRERALVGNRAKADQFARAILPIIEQIRSAGATTLTDIARELNARQVRTARGRRWYPMTVRNILQRNRNLER